MARGRKTPIIIYIPSARCGKEAQREAYTFAESVEHKMGLRVIRLERQMSYDLHPSFTAEESEEFCLDQLYAEIKTELDVNFEQIGETYGKEISGTF